MTALDERESLLTPDSSPARGFGASTDDSRSSSAGKRGRKPKVTIVMLRRMRMLRHRGVSCPAISEVMDVYHGQRIAVSTVEKYTRNLSPKGHVGDASRFKNGSHDAPASLEAQG